MSSWNTYYLMFTIFPWRTPINRTLSTGQAKLFKVPMPSKMSCCWYSLLFIPQITKETMNSKYLSFDLFIFCTLWSPLHECSVNDSRLNIDCLVLVSCSNKLTKPLKILQSHLKSWRRGRGTKSYSPIIYYMQETRILKILEISKYESCVLLRPHY